MGGGGEAQTYPGCYLHNAGMSGNYTTRGKLVCLFVCFALAVGLGLGLHYLFTVN